MPIHLDLIRRIYWIKYTRMYCSIKHVDVLCTSFSHLNNMLMCNGCIAVSQAPFWLSRFCSPFRACVQFYTFTPLAARFVRVVCLWPNALYRLYISSLSLFRFFSSSFPFLFWKIDIVWIMIAAIFLCIYIYVCIKVKKRGL